MLYAILNFCGDDVIALARACVILTPGISELRNGYFWRGLRKGYFYHKLSIFFENKTEN